MIGVLYAFLLSLSAILYAATQLKQPEMLYVWRVFIISMAAVGLATWGGDWRLHITGCALVVGIMAYAIGRTLMIHDDQPRWPVRVEITVLLTVIGSYAMLAMVASLIDESKETEGFIAWATLIIMSLFFTYTKKGAWAWAAFREN